LYSKQEIREELPKWHGCFPCQNGIFAMFLDWFSCCDLLARKARKMASWAFPSTSVKNGVFSENLEK
jgi:hypothetical protein